MISDAIEGCFAFDIETDKYTLVPADMNSMSYDNALDSAIEMEENIIRFYSDAGGQSKSLMTDITRLFNIMAKTKLKRKSTLLALLSA